MRCTRVRCGHAWLVTVTPAGGSMPPPGAFAVLGVTPDRAVRRSVRLASAPPSVSGGYWVRNKQRQPSQAARDDNAAARLWAVSEELITNAGIELPSLI